MELDNLINEITEITTKLATTIKQKNNSGDYFINSLCEDIFITTFNEIFDCDFKNLNYSKPNSPAVDLFDNSPEKKIIIQVTSDNSTRKLYDTLTKLINNLDKYKDYKNLYLFVLKSKSGSYRQPEVDKILAGNTEIIFNINQHIFDIDSIPKLIRAQHSNGMSIIKIIEIKERLDQSVNALDFKYKKLRLTDENNFAKNRYNFPEEIKIDREIVNLATRKKSNIENLFNNNSTKYAILKSNPGLGKSFSLYNYFKFLFEKATESSDNITPYILNFKDITANSNFEQYVISHFHKRKKPLLIIDGLDEIGDTVEQRRIEKNLYQYLKEHQNVMCLVSGRYDFITIKTEGYNELKFENYELAKLTQQQIQEYLQAKSIYHLLIKDADYHLIKDALQIPFNLYNVSEYFVKNKRLEKSIVFVNHKRINEDILKYCNSNEMLLLKSRLLLEKLSLINNIIENKVFSIREIAKMIKYDDNVFKTIRKIKMLDFESINETVSFSNNQKFFEDILVAYFLKDKDTDTILNLFKIGKSEVSIPQTWYNSLSMLTSLKGIESDFAKTIIADFSYILVNADDFGLSDVQKNEIFQKIFNLYEEKDIWIDNIKYEQNTLAKFGDNDLVFDFLIAKLNNPGSNFRTRSKSISQLAKFTPTQDRASILLEVIKNVIRPENNVGDEIPQSYYCLAAYNEFITLSQKKLVIDSCVSSKDDHLKYNEYVRSAVYYFITSNNLEDEYIDYLLEGLRLLDFNKKGQLPGRGDVTLVDEGFNLDNAFLNIKTKKSILTVIKELFNYFEKNDRYHSFTVFEKMILEATSIIIKEKNNKRFIKSLVNILSDYDVRNENWLYWKEVINNFNLHSFIIEVLKSEKDVLRNLINNKKIFASHFYISADVIANLVTDNSLNEILEGIDKGHIKLEDGTYIYDFVNNRDSILGKKFKKELVARNAIIIPFTKHPTKEETDAFKKEKFDLLFNAEDFLQDIIVFFRESDTIEFSLTAIPQWYNDKFFYNGDIRIEILQKQFHYKNVKNITKEKVVDFFNGPFIQHILNDIIFEKIKHFSYMLTEGQYQKLSNWLLSEVQNVDFRNAIHNVQKNTFSLDRNCSKLYGFKKILNISFDKETNLDLLSYYDIDNRVSGTDNKYDYFIDLVEEINDFNAVKQRVRENLESKIKYADVLDSHIMFSAKYNLEENYPLIEDIIIELIPEIQEGFFHNNPLKIYYSYTKNFEFLKKYIPETPNDLYWNIIDYLIGEKGHCDFVEENLNKLYENNDDFNIKLKVCNSLIKNNSQNALQKFLNTIKYVKEQDIANDFRFYDFSFGISNFKHVDIESAVGLIKLTYLYNFDQFDHPRNAMIGYFENLIKSDKKTYKKIKGAIQELIKDHRQELKDIQFLEMHLDRLHQTFYSTYKSNYTFNEALKIINKIDRS